MASSLSLIAVTGCGDDDDSTGTGGSTAKGGAGAGGARGGSGGSNGGSTTGGSGGGAKGGSGGTTGGNVGTGGTAGGASGAGGEPVVEGGAAGMGATAGMGGVDNGGAGGTDMGGAGGSVSDACTAYCTGILAVCSATADLQYPDMEHCLGTCPAFPRGAAAGNTLECRAQHAVLAATAGVEPHCQHAGPAGLGPCGGPCPAYCSLMMNICEGKFATEADCITACEAVPGGSTATLMTDFTAPVAAGNTLECRIYHATNAAAATTVASHDSHCGHAAGESLCVP